MSDAYVQPPREGDLPLLEGELPDVRQEAIRVVGREWLDTPNASFGWKTPDQVIASGYAYLVRNLLRLIRHVGSS
jgi:hypothetical protein